MRYWGILVLVVWLGSALPAWAQECDVRLKTADGYNELSAKLQCMNDKIKALEAALGQAGSGGKPNLAVNAPKDRSISKGNITVSLSKCEKSGGNIVCSYSILNNSGTDKEICFKYDGTRAISDSSKTSTEVTLKVGVNDRWKQDICDIAPDQIQMQGSLNFYGYAKDVSENLQLVRLNVGGIGLLNAYNVPIE